MPRRNGDQPTLLPGVLYWWIEEQGLTRVQAADALGVCENTVYKWLSARNLPYGSTCRRVACTLGVPVQDFYPRG